MDSNQAILLQCLSSCSFVPSLISTLQTTIALVRIDSEYFTDLHASTVLEDLAHLLMKSDSLLQSHVIEFAKLLAVNRKEEMRVSLTNSTFQAGGRLVTVL